MKMFKHTCHAMNPMLQYNRDTHAHIVIRSDHPNTFYFVNDQLVIINYTQRSLRQCDIGVIY